jgi:hypothetical protein
MRVVTRLCQPDDFLVLREVKGPNAQTRLFWFAMSATFWLFAGYDTWMLASEAGRAVFGVGAILKASYETGASRPEFVELFPVDPQTTSVSKSAGPSKFEETARPAFCRGYALSMDTRFGPRWAANLAGAGGIVEARRVASGQSIEFVSKARSL